MISEAQMKLETNNLYPFYKVYVASDYPGSKVKTPHIKKLAAKLTDIYKGKINKLCVAMPPRHSKSSMVTLAFPLWLIFRNPNTKILIVNAEASLSEKFGIQLREYVKRYGPLFGVYLSDVKHSSTHLMFERKDGTLCKGSIRLVGASGSITGQDADYLIIDDPYKGFDDITPTLLQKKIDWFKTMILQRLEPHSKLIILHTRWHSEDLQGYLKENFPEDYDFVEFSAIKKDGTPLWPQRYTLEYLQKQAKAMGERLFQALYQQKPIDETGDYFNVDKLIFHDEPFDQYYIANIRSWDMAFTKVENGYDDKKDYTVGVPMFKVNDWHYAITDFDYGQYGEDNILHVQSVARSDGVNTPIHIEPGTKGGAAKEVYRLWSEDYLKGYNTTQSLPEGTKVDRAFGFKNAILDGKIHVYIMDPVKRQLFINQLKAFPNSKHKDIVDACSYAFNYLNSIYDEDIYGTGEETY